MINYRGKIITQTIFYVKSLYLIFILVLILILSFLFSDKIYLIVFKDVLNVIIILSLYFFLYLAVNSKKELDYYIWNLINLMILFGFIISLIGIADVLTIISIRDSGRIDYNFALLPVFFGIIGIIYRLTIDLSLNRRILYNIFLFFFFTQVFLAGSRRGLIVIFVIFLILVLLQLHSLIYRKNKSKFLFDRFRKFTLFPLLSLLLIPAFYYLILFHTSYKFKENALDHLELRNKSMAKYNITVRLYRCISMFEDDLDFRDLYNTIWTTISDPYDPDSGWGIRIHETIFPLKGEGVGIVPENAKGYLIDSTSNADTWDGNAYSYTSIWSGKIENLDTIKASVYCYASPDFNGEWINLSCEGSTSGTNLTYYQLSKKGTWQKLTITQSCQDGEASVYLYLCKNGASDFSPMRGHVIFAFPQVELKKNKIQFDLQDTTISESINNNIVLNKKVLIENQLRFFSGSAISRICKHDFKKNFLKYIRSEKQSNSVKRDTTYPISRYYNSDNYSKASFLNLELFYDGLKNFYSTDTDPDPIRRLVSSIISEDTTYHGYKANFVIDTINNKFLGGRLIRWQFAWQIFQKEYTWKRKILGGGFNFLNWFGFYFRKDKTVSDYPHNPILYILLYSGIVGIVLYFVLMFKVFYLYFKYIKEYLIIFILFLITFFFSFFSAGNPFDPPVMGFFVILPFFIQYIYNNTDTVESTEKNG